MKAVLAWLAAATVLAPGAGHAQADKEPLVLGILVGASDGSEARALAGAKAYVGRINEGGGINGRKLRIASETFEPGAASAYADKLRKLVAAEKPIALFGCGDDATCEAAAGVAKEAQIPLLGPLSGASGLSRRTAPHVFRLRVGYDREATAISNQFRQLGSSRIAVVTDTASAGEADRLLVAALAKDGMQVQRLPLANTAKPALDALVKKLGDERFHAVVMNVRSETVKAIINNGLAERPEWPRILMTMANGSIATYTTNFKGRVIGFTQVVPNPEVMALPLSRELDEDGSKYSGALAWTHEGMEGYVTARLVVSALRKIGPAPTPDKLATTLVGTDPWDIGGFRLSFAKERDAGSDWLEIGLRSREGVLVR